MPMTNNSFMNKIPLMTADELVNFRKQLGLSQEELAAKLKVARNTVNRWENEARKIPEFLDLALETVERNIKAENQTSN